MKLELSVRETDGHVAIYCTHKGCVWHWQVPAGPEAEAARGRALDDAVRHAMTKEHDE